MIRTETAVTIFCFGGWIITVWSMGIFALTMGAPIIFPLFAFGMGCIRIVCGFTQYRSSKQRDQPADIRRYSDESIVYTGDYDVHSESKPQKQEKVYLIPAKCPSCGSPLTNDTVNWTGPLKALCPFCETILDAKEKIY